MKHGPYSLKRFPAELREQGQKYLQHLRNAGVRSIEWRFTFDEWWKVWQDSGHWAERGWGGNKYCMCRIGDIGPYAVGNVFIATNSENRGSAYRKELPIGVRSQAGNYYATKCIRGTSYHIGTFPTPELARAAYLNFSV